MEKKWLMKTQQSEEKIKELRNALKVDRIVASLLLQRGIETFEEAEAFFRPKLEDLHDPFLMKNMDLAVNRLQKAIENNEKILLFGDYDVDGTTAVALMYGFLKSYCPSIDFYIPDRYTEGYGISFQGIDYAKENGQTLIIALDCGVKAIDKVKYANEKGIDFIICDHHETGNELPDCIVLDQKQKDCPYPYKELSGCGVGFKLLQGFLQKRNESIEKLYPFLDLLAISIGADIVAITGENRILCAHGLRILNEAPRVAFKELLEISGKKFPLTLTDVVFIIAPRINAAGRIRSGRMAVELMISQDQEEMNRLAKEINADNLERRSLDQQITEEALQQIEQNPDFEKAVSTVVFDSSWHKGVVGIVASRLIERHYRPTIVLTESNGLIGGSARSVANFDLYKALTECEDLLEQFGGHQHAAGMTLKKENLAAFIKRFDAVVRKNLSAENKLPIQEIDVQIDLNEIHGEEEYYKIPRLKRIIESFEPHGPGNMKPVFYSTNLFAADSRLLKEAHLKLKVIQPNSKLSYDAIGFNLAHKELEAVSGVPFEMAYTLETNEFNGKKSIQLNIKDIRGIDINN
ncbi:MAG: single-stranded-DNA-specific exonuclease RecJ [Flavobacteriales bacterium]|nr:single-stranded-DNA-specific exonuclease RecJ [Flavobacteriales bacterium]